MLTVVVPVYNVEAHLAACLDSVLGQSLRNLEVIAVDDGSTDGSLAILEEYAARDPRLRVLTQANAGQGVARNAGVALARGEFLTFCDSDDVVPRRAYSHMVRTLRRTGSDFCVGAARRFTHRQTFGVSWPGVHDHDVLATTIDEFPAAMQDVIACNRMFRTDFWRDRVPAYRGGIAYEDHVPMVAAYVRAARFDVLARVTYRWRVREDNTSTGQQKAKLENLLDRIAVKEEAHALLRQEASPRVYDAWLARTLDVDFPPFLRFALAAGDMYRNVLSAACRTLVDRADDTTFDQVRFHAKLRIWLCAMGDWPAVAAAEEYFETHGRLPPVRLEDGVLLASPPPDSALHELMQSLPPGLSRLSLHESDLQAGVRSVQVRGTVVELAGYAVIRGLDSSEQPPLLDAWLQRDDQPEVAVPVRTRMVRDPRVNEQVRTPYADYAESGFLAEVEVDDLLAHSTSLPCTWSLRLLLRQGAVVREGLVQRAVDGSAVAQRRSLPLTAPGREPLLLTTHIGDRGLELTVATAPTAPPQATGPRAAASAVSLTEHAIDIELDLSTLQGATVAGATLRSDQVAVAADGVAEQGSTLHLRFPRRVDRWRTGRASTLPTGGYTLEVELADGNQLAAEPAEPLLADLPATRMEGDARLNLRVRRTGQLGIAVAPPVPADASTPRGQQMLRDAYLARRSSGELRETVLLMAADGRLVDGDPLAIDRALAQARPDLTRLWAVRSLDVQLPDGAVPVVVGTPDWYEALAASRYLVVDGDLPDYFERPPDQRVLQTFRGRPSKAMGRSWWTHQGLSPERVAQEIARRQRTWSAILAPTEEAAAAYRSEYDYDGPVIVGGSPRSDGLLTGDRDAVSARTRAALGIADDATVVLHAPTYRDTFSSRVASAPLPSELDLRDLAGRLGPEYAVLLRAHPLDRREAARLTQDSPVIDVTSYPDVTALLHAADLAVLDYSSLRFEWALTGRPAVCYVPDLASYSRVRGFLTDYPATAPGPLARDLDELEALLGQASGSGAAAAPALTEVNERYNRREDGHAAERAVRAFFTD